jgi:hypothetical protein
VRRERKELRQRAINGRTAEGRYVADQRGDLIASLGGIENVSVQKSWLVEEAAFLRLELAYLKAWLASQSPINKRKRAAHPIVKDYVGLVGALRGVLSDIGLERQTRQLPSLEEYIRDKASPPTPATAVSAGAPTGPVADPSPAAGPTLQSAACDAAAGSACSEDSR